MYKTINQMFALTGLAQSGKDTAAIILRDMLELQTYTIAEPVTQECARITHIEHHAFLSAPKEARLSSVCIGAGEFQWLYQHSTVKQNPQLLIDIVDSTTKREIMQNLGRLMRAFDNSCLVDDLDIRIACNETRSHLYNGPLITDVRMPQEVEYVKNNNGILISIVNPNAKPAREDATEKQVPQSLTDYTLTNDGTLEEFQQKVRRLALALRADLLEKAA